MKILLCIAAYLVVGFAFAIFVSKVATKNRGYPIHDFFDLDDDDQAYVIVSFLLWPVVVIVFSIAAICACIVAIANPEEKEHDNEKKA